MVLTKSFMCMIVSKTVICDDYAWLELPGAKTACDDFLLDKKEVAHQIPDYCIEKRSPPEIQDALPFMSTGAVIIKL